MNIPRPPLEYDAEVERKRNRSLEQADALNLKRNQDLRLTSPIRLILNSPDGTEWVVGVDNAGNFTATSL
ncbi:MAG: hypothetical protein ACPHCN_07230 [Mycobacterium sp.]